MARNLARYGIDLKIAKAYAESLEKHLMYLRQAGEAIGVPAAQLRAHDSSKWSLEEFPHYADWFNGSKSDPAGFERAWLHHLHHNKHHWQYWMFPDGFSLKGSNSENGVLQMPYVYIVEMVADWQGSSMAYTGSFDMTEWLIKNLPKITLHSKTRENLYLTLAEIGYDMNGILSSIAHDNYYELLKPTDLNSKL